MNGAKSSTRAMNVARSPQACKTREGITDTPHLLMPDSTINVPETAHDSEQFSFFCKPSSCVQEVGVAARVEVPPQRTQAEIVH